VAVKRVSHDRMSRIKLLLLAFDRSSHTRSEIVGQVAAQDLLKKIERVEKRLVLQDKSVA
jgi:hypothetical protein